MTISLRSAAIAPLLCASAALASPPTFTGIGDLPGGAVESSLYRISADGTTPVGYSIQSAGGRAVRWRAGSGLEDLGGLNSEAFGVSADGNVVVGDSSAAAFRWTPGSGIQSLGILPGGTSSQAYDVSDDGATVVGMSGATGGNRAFRWTQATGMVSLGVPPNSSNSAAFAISGDGSTAIVAGATATWRWTQANGYQPIPVLSGGTETDATSLSYNGSVIAGQVTTSQGPVAFRWTQPTGMISLGDLPGGDFASRALGISADGSAIVGSAHSAAGTEAFVWTQATGMVSLRSLLLSLGVNQVANWQLRWAADVSADGTTIAGLGIDPMGNTQGWVATIPAPGAAIILLLPFAACRRRATAT